MPELHDYAPPHVEWLEWPSPDGTPIAGYICYPPGYTPDSRCPLLTIPHGGPSNSHSPQYGLGPWGAWQHLLLQRGWALFLPNPRGSWGRGHAFQSANVGDLGGGDWQDISAGVDHLVALGIADSERLTIAGWSYGGYMTAWAISQTDRFRCAVAGAPIISYESNYGVASIRGWQTALFGSVVYDQFELHRSRSPLNHVNRVKTPTLLLHGERDQAVPVSQSIEFYTALKHLGVPVECVIYPREPHVFQEKAHQLDLIQRLVGWIDRYGSARN